MDVPTEIRAFETRAFELVADLCRSERWPLGSGGTPESARRLIGSRTRDVTRKHMVRCGAAQERGPDGCGSPGIPHAQSRTGRESMPLASSSFVNFSPSGSQASVFPILAMAVFHR